MHKKLLILGAGQYGTVVKEIAESLQCFEKIDFLDDKNQCAIDVLENHEKYAKTYSHAIVAIGNPDTRLAYIAKLMQAKFTIATLISPRAYVASSAKVMCGTVVEPMAVINANAVVSIGTLVCAGAVVNHNAVIGDGCVIQCGSIVTANAVLPAKTKLNYASVF